MTRAPQISLVVPTLGRLVTLRRLVARLAAQTVAADEFELVVAADARAEAGGEIDSLLGGQRYAAHRVTAAVAGASGARNAGWRAAEAPLLLFLDDDILPDPQLVAEHLAWHAKAPELEVGVLGHVRWAAELRVTAFMRWLEHGIQFNYPSIEGDSTVWGNFYTANASVKRSVVENVGGFDEMRLPYGYEDLDLALRMHETLGFRLLYNRRASAEHVHEMDIEFWKRRLPRVARAERRFVELHPEFSPYFYKLFLDATQQPRVSPQMARIAQIVPRRVPVVGPRVWSRADLFYRQSLAPSFLDAWEAHASESRTPVSSGGSPPGGPK